MDKVSSVEDFPPALLRIRNSSPHIIDFRSAMTTQWVSWHFETTVLRLFYQGCRQVTVILTGHYRLLAVFYADVPIHL